MEPEFTSHSCIPINMNYFDTGIMYNFEIHQKGIINSEDIHIILDYKKDYPTRLFQRLELYYDKELIATNMFPEYLTIKDKKTYSIKDLFPNYSFRLDTTNKLLKFKFLRNSIKAIVNDVKIMYKLDHNDSTITLNHFTSTVSPIISNRFSAFIEHKPIHIQSNIVSGHITSENYSEKPIQEIKPKIIKHFIDDKEISDTTLQEGMNVYFVETTKDDISLNNVIYYVYK